MNRCNMGVECLWRVEGQSRRNIFFYHDGTQFFSHDDSGCDHDGEDDVSYKDGDGNDGVHPNSHKHFIPYMGFCASIWDSVRHHCHHHHHHHDHLKWTVKQQRRRPKNLWANFKRLGWMDISILRHGPALDGRQT